MWWQKVLYCSYLFITLYLTLYGNGLTWEPTIRWGRGLSGLVHDKTRPCLSYFVKSPLGGIASTISYIHTYIRILLSKLFLRPTDVFHSPTAEYLQRCCSLLSDTVPLWSGSSYRAFVYIGNDGFCFETDCKHNNRKDKCRFPSVSKNSKEFKKWEHLNRLNSLIDTSVIAIVIKKSREPHCVICQMS